jgi:hypothetical protein
MERFLGVFASDHRRLACAVARAWTGFPPSDPAFRGRMGLGTYGGDEVLLMRRPVGPDVQGDAWIGPAPGNHALFAMDDTQQIRFTPETTAPWRYRNLLGVFALGAVPDPGFGDRVRTMIPEFMAREARNEPPEALAFRLVLSVLHDMGRLDARTIPSDSLAEALRTAIRMWPRASGEDGAPVPGMAACVTDGRSLVAGATGLPLYVWPSDSIPDCARCSEPARSKDHDPIRVRHDDLRMVVVAGGDVEPWNPGFRPLADGAVAVVDETGAFRVRSPVS